MLFLPDEITCGYWDSSEFPGMNRSPVRCVTRFEIEFYPEDGKFTYTDGVEYPIKKNHIQISRPGQKRYSLLPFKTLYIKFPVEGELAERLRKCPTYFPASHPELIQSKFDEIIRLNECGNKLLMYSHLLALLDLVFFDGEIPVRRSGKSYEPVTKAKEFIRNHLAEKLTLSQIAKEVHLSEIYFHTLFTEASGMSPHDFLTSCRIEHAKKLLWNTSISMGDVAEQSGMGTQQNLNRVFKRETGTTPALYRRNFQKNYLY